MSLPLFGESPAAPPRPLTLRKVAAVDELLAGLVGRCWHWPGMDGGPPCRLLIDRVLSPLDVPGESGVCLSWAGMRFWLVGAPKLVQVLCGFNPWLGAPPAASGQVGWPLRDVVAVLNNFLFSRTADWMQPVAEMPVWSSAANDKAALECSIWSDDGVWLDRFWLVPSAVDEAVMSLPSVLRRSGLRERQVDAAPAVPLRLPVVVGEAAVSLRQLRVLVPGDALCFTRSLMTGLDQLLVDCPGGRLNTRVVDATRLEALGPVEFSEPARGRSMDDELNMGDLSLELPQGEGAVSVAGGGLMDLPVRVQAVAGVVSLTVAELGRLKAGDSITLEQPAQPFVRLLANGQEIGAGELVDIDGKLGVQISRWDIQN